MRLAEHVAKTVDVDEMLEGMTPRQFAEWCAKDSVEPIKHLGSHELLAQIATMLATFMGVEDVDQYSYLWWRQRPESEKTVSVDVAAMALQTIGAKRNG